MVKWRKMDVFLLVYVLVISVEVSESLGLFYTNETHILKRNTTSGVDTVIVAKTLGNVVGLATDVADNALFWSDHGGNKNGIYRSTLDGSNIERIVTSDLYEVNGLAVDWTSNHLYWTDAQKGTIEMSNYGGKNRQTLIRSDLFQPRGIVADPENGYLFWGDQGKRRIERSELDGAERKVMDSDVIWPNQLSVQDGAVYWVDAWKKSLHSIPVQGGSSVTVATLAGAAKDNVLYGLAVTKDKAYVTVWGTGDILAIDLQSKDVEVVATGRTKDVLFSLAMDSMTLQPPGSSPCGSSFKGGCSHMCTPTPSGSSRCSCPTYGGLTLSSDRVTCREPSEFLLYALTETGEVGMLDAESGSVSRVRTLIGTSTRPVAVTYDPLKQLVYWSDVQERTIYRAKLDGSDKEMFLNSSSELGFVEGLAVDWRRRRLYFANYDFVTVDGTAYSWHRIESIGLAGQDRTVVVTDVDEPRGLWIDSYDRYLYYTDWGKAARVVRTDLDGSNPVVIQSGLDSPNAVAASYSDVYVIDAHSKERETGNATLQDGNLYQGHSNEKTWKKLEGTSFDIPFGLAKSGQRLFVSDWGKKAIVSYNIGTNKQQILLEGVSEPSGLYFTQKTAFDSVDSTCSSSQCGDICMRTPYGSSSDTSCTCNSYNTSFLQEDGKTCEAAESFALVADMNRILKVRLGGSKGRQVHTLVTGPSYFASFSALAHDETKNVLYFTDVNRKAIYRTSLTKGQTDVLVKTDHIINGLAVDPRKQRLYWTSANLGLISRLELSNTTSQRVLVSGLDQPRDIVVEYTKGDIYWSEVGKKPAVKTSWTNGENIHTVTDSIKQPNGLYLDPAKNLYVADADSKLVWKCGSTCEVLHNLTLHVSVLYGISIIKDHLLYTDLASGSLYKTPLSGGGPTALATGLMRPTQLVVKIGADGGGLVLPTLPATTEKTTTAYTTTSAYQTTTGSPSTPSGETTRGTTSEYPTTSTVNEVSTVTMTDSSRTPSRSPTTSPGTSTVTSKETTTTSEDFISTDRTTTDGKAEELTSQSQTTTASTPEQHTTQTTTGAVETTSTKGVVTTTDADVSSTPEASRMSTTVEPPKTTYSTTTEGTTTQTKTTPYTTTTEASSTDRLSTTDISGTTTTVISTEGSTSFRGSETSTLQISSTTPEESSSSTLPAETTSPAKPTTTELRTSLKSTTGSSTTSPYITKSTTSPTTTGTSTEGETTTADISTTTVPSSTASTTLERTTRPTTDSTTKGDTTTAYISTTTVPTSTASTTVERTTSPTTSSTTEETTTAYISTTTVPTSTASTTVERTTSPTTSSTTGETTTAYISTTTVPPSTASTTAEHTIETSLNAKSTTPTKGATAYSSTQGSTDPTTNQQDTTTKMVTSSTRKLTTSTTSQQFTSEASTKAADVEPPVFKKCPTGISVFTKSSSRNVWWPMPSAEDNNRVQNLKSSHQPGAIFGLGTTVVSYNASDAAGNVAICQFNVTVKTQSSACEVLPSPVHGQMMCLEANTNRCRIECNSGYSLNTDVQKEYECQKSGWIPNFPQGLASTACSSIQPIKIQVKVRLQLKGACPESNPSFKNDLVKGIINILRAEKVCATQYGTGSHCDPRYYDVKCEGETDQRRSSRDTGVINVDISVDAETTNSTIVPDVLRKIQEMLNGLKSQVDAGRMVVTENGVSFPAKSLNMTSSSWGCASGQQLQENGCFDCPIGMAWNSSSKQCIVCGPGSFQNESRQDRCKSCESTYTSKPGSFLPSQCVVKVVPTSIYVTTGSNKSVTTTETVLEPTEGATGMAGPNVLTFILIGVILGVAVLIILIILIITLIKKRSHRGKATIIQDDAVNGHPKSKAPYYNYDNPLYLEDTAGATFLSASKIENEH